MTNLFGTLSLSDHVKEPSTALISSQVSPTTTIELTLTAPIAFDGDV